MSTNLATNAFLCVCSNLILRDVWMCNSWSGYNRSIKISNVSLIANKQINNDYKFKLLIDKIKQGPFSCLWCIGHMGLASIVLQTSIRIPTFTFPRLFFKIQDWPRSTGQLYFWFQSCPHAVLNTCPDCVSHMAVKCASYLLLRFP